MITARSLRPDSREISLAGMRLQLRASAGWEDEARVTLGDPTVSRDRITSGECASNDRTTMTSNRTIEDEPNEHRRERRKGAGHRGHGPAGKSSGRAADCRGETAFAPWSARAAAPIFSTRSASRSCAAT